MLRCGRRLGCIAAWRYGWPSWTLGWCCATDSWRRWRDSTRRRTDMVRIGATGPSGWKRRWSSSGACSSSATTRRCGCGGSWRRVARPPQPRPRHGSNAAPPRSVLRWRRRRPIGLVLSPPPPAPPPAPQPAAAPAWAAAMARREAEACGHRRLLTVLPGVEMRAQSQEFDNKRIIEGDRRQWRLKIRYLTRSTSWRCSVKHTA
mmetsp:Transcript_10380/g.32457  ORF Transcript_10380/g.32457 Transcript_10380/m.32457 type:complete len:204 (-) Transcript_10380:107-718(-)